MHSSRKGRANPNKLEKKKQKSEYEKINVWHGHGGRIPKSLKMGNYAVSALLKETTLPQEGKTGSPRLQ